MRQYTFKAAAEGDGPTLWYVHTSQGSFWQPDRTLATPFDLPDLEAADAKLDEIQPSLSWADQYKFVVADISHPADKKDYVVRSTTYFGGTIKMIVYHALHDCWTDDKAAAARYTREDAEAFAAAGNASPFAKVFGHGFSIEKVEK